VIVEWRIVCRIGMDFSFHIYFLCVTVAGSGVTAFTGTALVKCLMLPRRMANTYLNLRNVSPSSSRASRHFFGDPLFLKAAQSCPIPLIEEHKTSHIAR